MSEIMRLIPFENMVDWMLEEYKDQGSIFGIRKEKMYRNKSGKNIVMFGDKLSSPVGPAAGPNAQLAQNIVASYLTGSRFIELKTVQVMDGEALRNCVPRPCINAQDEGFNVEWSTELTVEQAQEEYTKAWFAVQVMAKELGISDVRDFAYNMSVGYDLAGIQTPKIDGYIEGMKDASNTKVFKACQEYLVNNIDKFKNVTKEDVMAISPNICQSITLSTMHGCPPEEIEKIARYLIKEKNIHTFVKCNPTLLGYDFAKNILSEMGYDFDFGTHHFDNDLQYADGIAMIKRLRAYADECNRAFGVKLTNTFAMPINNNELPGDEMYMSGRSLYPLTISLANKLSKEFNGELPISFSGGADHFNIAEILKTGIQPITFATTILKPGGYERIKQMADDVESEMKGEFNGVDLPALDKLATGVVTNKFHLKDARPVGSRKTDSILPIFDCAKAPCKDGGCPINQQIPEYLQLVSDKKYDEAFKVIVTDNASPAVTGTICDHQCQHKCTRLDYEASLEIRNMKKIAVMNAQDNYIANMKASDITANKKVAIVGAGPGGVATALFLRRNGVDVTVFEKRQDAYGIVKYVIPGFRISDEMINKDVDMAKKAGVKFEFGKDISDVASLKADFDYVVLAVGAWKEGISPVKEGGENLQDALAFLEDFKTNDGKLSLGKTVAVIGGGDVAMDCARAAKRVPGVEKVVIVYRRTKAFMPAQPEEKAGALADGVEFKELLGPVSYKDGVLTCEYMALGEKDASGRKSVKGTGETATLNFDTVIGATGARIDTTLFEKNSVKLDSKGYPEIKANNESSIAGVYIAGDCKAGASTIVKAIADGKVIAEDILGKAGLKADFARYSYPLPENVIYERKGVLVEPKKDESEGKRCLACEQICEICCDVCPNRANVVIKLDGLAQKHQIVHIDAMCNECGNCGIFCPHTGNPYKDKVTVFWTEEDFKDSENRGYLATGDKTFKVRTEDGSIVDYTLGEQGKISKEMGLVLDAVLKDYDYYVTSL